MNTHQMFFAFFRLILLPLYILQSSLLQGQNCSVKQYTTEHGLPTNNVTQLIFDGNQYLWIGTQAGLCVFDGVKYYTKAHQEMYTRIALMAKDNFGKVYVMDGKESIFGTSLINQKINLLYKKKGDEISWFYRNNSTLVGQDKKSNDTYRLLENLSYKNIKKITKDSIELYISKLPDPKYVKKYFLLDTNLVVITPQLQYELHSPSRKIKKIQSSIAQKITTPGLIFYADDGTFWLVNNTIYKFELLNDTLKAIPIIAGVPLDRVEHNLIVGLHNKNNGHFYFGSSVYGLYEVIPAEFNVLINKNSISKYTTPDIATSYYSQAEMKDGKILINNYLILDSNGHATINKVNIPEIRATNYVDIKNNLWYADGNNLIIKRKNSQLNILNDSINHHCVAICPFDSSTYYLSYKHQIVKMQNFNLVDRITYNELGIDRHEIINYIYKDSKDGTLLLLTDKHLHRFYPENKKCKKIEDLPDGDFRIMKTLTDNIIFVGTYGNGFYIYHNGQMHQMPMDFENHLKFAHTAMLDSQGYVWISTNNGLFNTRLQDITDYINGKRKDIFYYYYDKSAGFNTNEFNGGCQSPAIQLSNGKISFSTINGLVQFLPSKINPIFPIGSPLITKIWIDGKEIDTVPPALVVNQKQNEIKIQFSIVYYGNLKNLDIAYRIGNSGNWIDVESYQNITVQNLPKGTHNISIRIRNGYGSNDFRITNYEITVLPYFYQTWWFITLLIMLGLLLSYLFSRWYNRYMIQKNKELEALIAEKNAGLIQINKTLTEKIKQNDLFQSILVHDIKSPLRFIVSTTKLILNFWPSVTDEIKKENISHINESASKIGNFVEETLLWIQIRNGEHEPQNSKTRIIDVLLENIELYNEDPKIISGDISVHVECPPLLYVFVDQSLLSTIMRNLMANSIKYSDRGKISLYAYQEKDGSICIGCKDEGRGMTNNVIDAILSDDYKGNSIRKDSFRIGYVIIKEIIRLLDAKLSITSNTEKGSDICIVLKITF